MNRLNECQAVFDAWIKEFPRSDCDFVMKRHNRRRLETQDGTRPPRDKTPIGQREKMYMRQRGICPWCKGDMDLDPHTWDVDHTNPNLTGSAYNHRSNKTLMHKKCNEEKNAMSLEDQAKHLGRTVTEILQPGYLNAANDEEEEL